MIINRDSIRQQIRQQRNKLTKQEQQQAAQQLVQQLAKLPEVIHAQHIAIYLSHDGELDTTPFIQWCWQQNKHVYLPVLHPFTKGHLLFFQYTRKTPMQKNKFAIPEPKLNSKTLCPLIKLDLLCMPLVAFDSQGNRLGMGGGFYDRTLVNYQQHLKKPHLIGLAHNCQQVDKVPVDYWDVPLQKIVTPHKIIQPSKA